MAQRRMFSQRIINSARFLQMPAESQMLYFHLGMRTDDDGVVEAYPIIRMLGLASDVMKILIAKNFIIELNEDQVCFVVDFDEHNVIRADRKINSIYKPLLDEIGIKTIEPKPRSDVKDNTKRLCGQSTDGISKVRLGKDKLGKDNTITKVIAEKSEYGNEDINWLIKEFETVMGFKSAGGGKDRLMAKHLLNNFSKEQLTAMLKYCATQEYAPRVGSVEKMWYKRGDIIAGIKSLKNNKTIQSL